MDEEAFRKSLKHEGRSQSAVKRAIAQVAQFEQYLRVQRGGKELNTASPGDLEAFVSHVEEKRRGAPSSICGAFATTTTTLQTKKCAVSQANCESNESNRRLSL